MRLFVLIFIALNSAPASAGVMKIVENFFAGFKKSCSVLAKRQLVTQEFSLKLAYGKQPSQAQWQWLLDETSILTGELDLANLAQKQIPVLIYDYDLTRNYLKGNSKYRMIGDVIYRFHSTQPTILEKISKHTAVDLELLTAANLEHAPHEAYQLSADTKNGRFFGSIHHGNADRLSVDSIGLENEVMQILSSKGLARDSLTGWGVNHVHPVSSMLFMGLQEVSTDLSTPDIDFGLEVSTEVFPGVSFTIQATTPGESYSVEMMDGKVVDRTALPPPRGP